ncbi:MAG TPA: FAD-binding and (Fe-S)-binding domain-containing protein [Polyangiaceae bacterium]|nr:FAD-binding and (Fe-S)-binding domain-containing protein [Polyangiaceae bacterium]
MIPALAPQQQIPVLYREFLAQLAAKGFSGEIRTDYASRLVAATDNSVYQLVPVAVIFPKHEADVVLALRLAHDDSFRDIKLSPRGGGTGTNGQALCDGVIMDVSRHQNQILEVNLSEGWVRVEPGVVLDQLNDHLRPHGVFFAPNLSPSSRATLGGMINTDACGKGSRVYGKTSNHVIELRSVLLDGTVHTSQRIGPEELERLQREPGILGEVHRTVHEIVTTRRGTIAKQFPRLARFLTGYNLAHVVDAEGGFNLNYILSGSEGTLAVVTQAKLKLTPLPKHKQLFAVRYTDFDAALRAANLLVASDPGAIETVDSTIVGLAKNDVIWHTVAHLLDAKGEAPLAAVNLIEFESDDPDVVARKVAELAAMLDAERGLPGKATGYTIASKSQDIASLWALRKKGVGLLGNVQGERRPVPFVEDTAVPPERLADYIRDFRAILDRHGLRYGMFGHVDVGCLHVRPALNLRDPKDAALLRQLSDEVTKLVKSYGGVLWAEHGKGFRSEYSPTFFGPELYQELRKVKGAFDPYNQLNPGKLATPPTSGERLVSVDAKKRGDFDRDIGPGARARFDSSVHCNGNGQCFDYHPDHVMCPSSKVTRDRIHSPKGRAGILREWLRQMTVAGHDPGKLPGKGTGGRRSRADAPEDFSHEVYDAMNGCLACKACATQCPIKVDVPELRAEFLAHYHSRYRRPIKDYFTATLERVLVLMGKAPRFFNWFFEQRWFNRALERWVGIVDSPKLSAEPLRRALEARGMTAFDLKKLRGLDAAEKRKTVLVAQDAFTTFYETNVALAVYDVLTRLGLNVVFLPYRENGKALHIKGFMGRFRRVVRRNSRFYARVAELGLPIVGIEPAVTLTYRGEYPLALADTGHGHAHAGHDHAEPRANGSAPYRIQLLQEFLSERLPELGATALARAGESRPGKPLQLFGHCTERTEAVKSQEQWRSVFKAFGVELEPRATGCCGMCGVYGHEAVHYQESRGVFDMSWGKQLPKEGGARVVLAQGHSCRSQVKRFAGFVPRHPMEALRDLLEGAAPSAAE